MISNDEYGLLSIKYPYDIVDTKIRHKFEDIEVSGVSQYDGCLSFIYGDYMTPPDLSQSMPRHSV